jgi:hypothetical protein
LTSEGEYSLLISVFFPSTYTRLGDFSAAPPPFGKHIEKRHALAGERASPGNRRAEAP